MKISHELPISLLPYSYKWNDFDYLLPCFMGKYPGYREYFLKAKEDGRFIIMDNSLFEGYHHTNAELLSFIELIQPNIFIVPDSWNDSEKTIYNAQNWIERFNLPGTQLMVVLQGNTFDELINMYKVVTELGYTHIAINHSSNAYLNYFSELPVLEAQMKGRMKLVDELIKSNVLIETNYHHLLGCSLPQEVMAYIEFNWIKSIDTSNPIIVGYKGVRYSDNGIEFKPTEKIEDLFEVNLGDKMEDILFNINKFRSYTK